MSLMHPTAVMEHLTPGDGHPWQIELEFLWTEHRPEMLALLDSVVVEGFHEPILIGEDGRLWDGHHRLAVALALDVPLPVQIASKAGAS